MQSFKGQLDSKFLFQYLKNISFILGSLVATQKSAVSIALTPW
jgi:hypothetical protein